jgi:peptidoglycan/LPS O-acetylase OafA/YrhL
MHGRALRNKGHIAGIDGLRAIAIIFVIFCHANFEFGGLAPPNRIDRIFANIFSEGWSGVELFFVISGFLITRILFRTKGSATYYKSFYARRALRIFPLYYVYILFFLFLLPQIANRCLPEINNIWTFWGEPRWPLRASVLFYYYNFVVAALHSHLPLVNHFWSLSVEEHFYLLWPLIVASFGRRSLMRICLAGCGLSFILRCWLAHLSSGKVDVFVLTPCRLDGIFLGAWLALALADPGDERLVQWWAGRAFAISLVAVTATLIWLPLLEYKVFTFSVLFASGLALMFKRDWLSRWLDRPLLRALGRYSYGIYMYHMVMLYCITALLHTSKLLAHIPGWLTKSILSLLIIAITGLIAFLSYRFFESFFLGLKSKWPEGEACLRISTKIAPSEGAMCLTARLPTGLSTENPLV